MAQTTYNITIGAKVPADSVEEAIASLAQALYENDGSNNYLVDIIVHSQTFVGAGQ